MTEHDIDALFEHYPTLISQVANPFTSHKFILHPARQHQALHITALYDYINLPNPQHLTPFKTVHGILAKLETIREKSC